MSESTRPNEFGSMTARKGDIKPQYYKEQGHTWLYNTIQDHRRSNKAIQGHVRPYRGARFV